MLLDDDDGRRRAPRLLLRARDRRPPRALLQPRRLVRAAGAPLPRPAAAQGAAGPGRATTSPTSRPAATWSALNERLGFQSSTPRPRSCPNLPWPSRPGRDRISSDPSVIERTLTGARARSSTATTRTPRRPATSCCIRGGEWCYVDLPQGPAQGPAAVRARSCTSATRTLFRRMARPFARHLLLRHGVARHAGRAARRRAPPAAVARAALAAAEDVPEPDARAGPDRLPLQRAGLRGVVSRGPRGQHRTMRTQLHHLVADTAAAAADAPALTYKDDDAHATPSSGTSVARLRRRAAPGSGSSAASASAIYLDKRIETVVAIFGTSAAGGVFVPVNPLLQAAAGRPTSSPTATCGSSSRPAERLDAAARRAGASARRSSTSSLVGGRRRAGAGDGATCTRGTRSRRRRARPPSRRASTSTWRRSSTPRAAPGKPKGVVLSHRNLVVGAESVSQYLGNHADDVHPRRAAAELRRRASAS